MKPLAIINGIRRSYIRLRNIRAGMSGHGTCVMELLTLTLTLLIYL